MLFIYLGKISARSPPIITSGSDFKVRVWFRFRVRFKNKSAMGAEGIEYVMFYLLRVYINIIAKSFEFLKIKS